MGCTKTPDQPGLERQCGTQDTDADGFLVNAADMFRCYTDQVGRDGCGFAGWDNVWSPARETLPFSGGLQE